MTGPIRTSSAQEVSSNADSGSGYELVFLELICAHPEWLEREFMALIDANFPPSHPSGAVAAIPPHRPPARPVAVVTATAGRPRDARAGRGSREGRPRWRERRSPSPRTRERSPPQ
jgi:hypothetical protein